MGRDESLTDPAAEGKAMGHGSEGSAVEGAKSPEAGRSDLPAAAQPAGLPFLSIIIPCRNEEDFIGACLESILANNYPNDRLEVLIMDGMSEDRTRAIVSTYARQHSFIQLLDNHRKIKPVALNLGIGAAKGDLIMRMDAHARYAPDYISQCVYYLQSTTADNVGGIRKTEPQEKTLWGKAIAYSISHPLTAGNALYRTGAKSARWADTVFGGCYRREVFEKVGMFNEVLIRAQDREFNERLVRAGGRILLVPSIQCTYYARSHPMEYSGWIFEAGAWPFYGSRLSGRRFYSLRNFVPMAFVASLLWSFVLAWFTPLGWWLLGLIVLPYSVAALVFSLPLVKEEWDLRFLIVAPCVFAITHICYGVGSIWGILKPLPGSLTSSPASREP